MVTDRFRCGLTIQRPKSKRIPAAEEPASQAEIWAGMLEHGEIGSRAELARRVRVSRAQVTQVLGRQPDAIVTRRAPTSRDTAMFALDRGRVSRNKRMNTSRFIVGVILIALAVIIFLFGGKDYSTAGAIGLGVLGLVSIAISRKKNSA